MGKVVAGKHIAIYVRVSSKKQTLESQLPDLNRWAAMQEGNVKYYRDHYTGKSFDRPGWNKMMQAVESGKVSAICCWREFVYIPLFR